MKSLKEKIYEGILDVDTDKINQDINDTIKAYGVMKKCLINNIDKFFVKSRKCRLKHGGVQIYPKYDWELTIKFGDFVELDEALGMFDEFTNQLRRDFKGVIEKAFAICDETPNSKNPSNVLSKVRYVSIYNKHRYPDFKMATSMPSNSDKYAYNHNWVVRFQLHELTPNRVDKQLELIIRVANCPDVTDNAAFLTEIKNMLPTRLPK